MINMKIYYADRGRGKTTKAIELSIKHQMPIVCINNHHKTYIIEKAKEMGVFSELPKPLLKEEIHKEIIGNRVGLIIDDLEDFLKVTLGDNVYYATIVDCDITHIKENNNYE